MKNLLATLVLSILSLGSAAMAADLSSVGSTSTEVTADYSYLRGISTPAYEAKHEAQVGLQLNAGGLGSLSVAAGDTQNVTNYRVNYPTFTFGYANGIKIGNTLGGVGLVGAVDYSVLTGDKWFPLAHGHNSAIPTHEVSGTVELNAPVGFVFTHYLINVRPFVDYTYTREVGPNTDGRAVAVAGLYAVPTTFAPHLVTKVGYVRNVQDGPAQGVTASLSYKF